jgi:hypothetical protein
VPGLGRSKVHARCRASIEADEPFTVMNLAFGDSSLAADIRYDW